MLQHPSEHKRALATVPLLEAALHNIWVRASEQPRAVPAQLPSTPCQLCNGLCAQVIRSRVFRPGRTPPLDAVLAAARRPVAPLPLYMLWPDKSAADVTRVGVSADLAVARRAAQRRRECPDAADAADDDELTARLARCAYALIVPDSTWPMAAEMARALTPHVCPPATLVRLQHASDGAVTSDAAQLMESTMLRTEPMPGCMVTASAVAAALGELEGGGDAGSALREALLAPVRLMLAHQRRHDTMGKSVRRTQRTARCVSTADAQVAV